MSMKTSMKGRGVSVSEEDEVLEEEAGVGVCRERARARSDR